MTEPILGFFGDYRFLSNFEGPGFTHDGIWYPTNEHFYQAWKTDNLDQFMQVRGCETAGGAKRAGRRVIMRPNWDEIKDSVMGLGLSCKFNHGGPLDNHNAAVALLETDDAYLEETNTWGDTYWGVCDGQGQNKLGYALMNLRLKLGGAGVPDPF